MQNWNSVDIQVNQSHCIIKTSQELRMLSRSLSDCRSLLLNLYLNLNRCLCLCSDCSDSRWNQKSDSLNQWVSEWVSDWQGHLLSCPGQLKTVQAWENISRVSFGDIRKVCTMWIFVVSLRDTISKKCVCSLSVPRDGAKKLFFLEIFFKWWTPPPLTQPLNTFRNLFVTFRRKKSAF